MIFHEVYGSYYAAVGRLIAAALSYPLSERDAAQLIGQSAFSESFLHIAEAVKSGQWPVLYAQDSCWETPLTRRPLRPMTLLERRWLAAVAEDARMRLFCSDGELAQLRRMVAGVPPLYAAGDFAVVDRVEQADDYEAPQYQQHFRTIMTALREHRLLAIAFRSRKDRLCCGRYAPIRMEYSEKEDRFRLLAWRNRQRWTINVARILECSLFSSESCVSAIDDNAQKSELQRKPEQSWPQQAKEQSGMQGAETKRCVELWLSDQRGALERAMLHFADLKKETRQIQPQEYRVTLWYRQEDETEILIRILSFGPMLKVTGPENFLAQIRQRLARQNDRRFS